MKDCYTTIKTSAATEIKIKGSHFIGNLAPCANETSAMALIHSLSKQYHDASHHCFAFRIWDTPSPLFRYSDAREPSGTAGRPILDAIEHVNYFQCVCVVTRYFGGTKLGTGGLARAYRQCTEAVLSLARPKTVFLTESIKIRFDYDLTGAVMSYIAQRPIEVLDSVYKENTELHLSLRLSQVENTKKDLTELSAGKIMIEDIHAS